MRRRRHHVINCSSNLLTFNTFCTVVWAVGGAGPTPELVNKLQPLLIKYGIAG